MTTSRAGVFVLALAAVGCGDAPAQPMAATDSIALLAPVPTWTVEPGVALVDVDSPATTEFSDIVESAVLEGGLIAVGDGLTREVRIFSVADAGVRHVTTLGGVGEGPGEFTRLYGIANARGDSVSAWDSNAGRISVLPINGGTARTLSLDLPRTGWPPELRLTSEGELMVGQYSLDNPESSVEDRTERLDSLYISIDRRGEIARVRADESVHRIEDVGGGFVMSMISARPFGSRPFLAAGRDAFVIATNAVFGFSVYTSGAQLRSEVAFPQLARATTQAHLDSYASSDSIPNAGDYLSEFSPPATLPAFDRLLLSTSDEIWLRRVDPLNAETSEWLVVSMVGEIVGRVEIPADLEVHAVGTDILIASTIDEFDVPSLWIHQYRRGA